jgi:hypothetical protein
LKKAPRDSAGLFVCGLILLNAGAICSLSYAPLAIELAYRVTYVRWRQSCRSILVEATMTIIRRTIGVAFAALLLAAASVPALSRSWKPTPSALARDYVMINDTRPGGEVILLMWFVPELLPPETPNAATVKALLDKYVIMMAVHAKLDKVAGKFSFEDVNTLQAKDRSGKPLTLITGDEIPPTARGAVTIMEAMFRQSLGAFGQGTKVFVFDAAGVTSCKPDGGLTVLFAGETYTWQTPIPGCAAP